MLGNAISGFAIGLLVLDYSGSVFLYTLFLVAYNLPKIVMPIIAGPFLDKFSRKRTIYCLDFLSSGIYMLLALLMFFREFNYSELLFFSLLIGSIDSVYQVAYDSFYPNVITPGNFRKAYSVSSMIFPLSAAMIPVSAYVYEIWGITPLFIFNALSFLIAAIFETRIETEETHDISTGAEFGISGFKRTFIEGVSYIKSEKGLIAITVYFCLSFFCGASDAVVLPYFKSVPDLGVYKYCLVMGAFVVGRLCGGVVQYRLRYPADKKFQIAVAVYIILSVISGGYLYLPLAIMTVLSFISGALSVTSYNIRVAATQSYVPDDKRARFNGVFQMLCNTGQITGQLAAGALAEIVPPRVVIVIFMSLNFVSALGVMLPARKKVEPIYNQDI